LALDRKVIQKHTRDDKCIKNVAKIEGRDYLRDPDIDRRITLKWIYKKHGLRM
jgi:hypothetical protein